MFRSRLVNGHAEDAVKLELGRLWFQRGPRESYNSSACHRLIPAAFGIATEPTLSRTQDSEVLRSRSTESKSDFVNCIS